MNAESEGNEVVHRKKRAVQSLLIGLALWPLLHAPMVARYEMDPWKFFGWAMYSRPSPRIALEIDLVEGQQRRRVPPAELSPDVREAAQTFGMHHSAVGRLAEPQQLAALALASMAEADGVVVRVRRLLLDEGSARLREVQSEYTYERSSPPSATDGSNPHNSALHEPE